MPIAIPTPDSGDDDLFCKVNYKIESTLFTSAHAVLFISIFPLFPAVWRYIIL